MSRGVQYPAMAVQEFSRSTPTSLACDTNQLSVDLSDDTLNHDFDDFTTSCYSEPFSNFLLEAASVDFA